MPLPKTIIEWPETRLHAVDREPSQVMPAVVEGLDEVHHLVGHRHIAHQPIVGIERDAKTKSLEDVDGVLCYRGSSSCVNVRGRTNLERDPAVANIGGKPSEFDLTVIADRDVVDDANPVPESFCTAVLHCFPD